MDRSTPQHRGTSSGGTLPSNMAKSSKNGGIRTGEGTKHWNMRWERRELSRIDDSKKIEDLKKKANGLTMEMTKKQAALASAEPEKKESIEIDISLLDKTVHAAVSEAHAAEHEHKNRISRIATIEIEIRNTPFSI